MKERGISILFAVALFVSASLLFSVQPMVARMVLPHLGGSPAVWATCMLFFQAILLSGYAYSHFLSKWLSIRGQSCVHLLILLASLSVLPFASPANGAFSTLSDRSDPTWLLLSWLIRTIGLPVFALAATAPLLQYWFSATNYGGADDPYHLYAASNTGSLLALLAYPLVLERMHGLGDQSRIWAVGTGVFTALVALCATTAAISPGRREGIDRSEEARAIDRSTWMGWVALAAIPSSLMLGVTTYLTTDLAAIPLLWIVPLSLYLVSFIVAFSDRARWLVRLSARFFPIMMMVQTPVMAGGLVQSFWIPLHLITFFFAATTCHGELARRRPAAIALTRFYLAIAAGGVLGGIFNALIAPRVFRGIAEYPIALVASCMVLAFRSNQQRGSIFSRRDLALPICVTALASAVCANLLGIAESGWGVFATMLASGMTVLVAVHHRRKPARFGWTMAGLFLASSLSAGVGGRVVERSRNFFGVVKVTELEPGPIHRLFHGSTLHGQQNLGEKSRREPSTYFDRSGPVGQIFEEFHRRPIGERRRIVVTGMGVGSLAAYAEPGEIWTFIEINPAVVEIARNARWFTFLSESRADRMEIVEDDARIAMGRSIEGKADLMILDAFSSDAIPVHLLTREALALDRGKLAKHGLIVINITNRYLDLIPVIAALADNAGMACVVRFDPTANRATGKQGSIWAVLAAEVADLGTLADRPGWFRPPVVPGVGVWTDDYSNPLDAMRWGSMRRRARAIRTTAKDQP